MWKISSWEQQCCAGLHQTVKLLRRQSFNLYGEGNGSVASTPYIMHIITAISHTSHTNSWACSFPRKVTHDKSVMTILLSRFPAHELLFRLPEISDKSGLVCVSVVASCSITSNARGQMEAIVCTGLLCSFLLLQGIWICVFGKTGGTWGWSTLVNIKLWL